MTALLRTVRRQRGLTLARLAELTGLTKSYLSKIEREQANPSIATALKVAGALDVDVAQLFAGDRTAGQLAVDRAQPDNPQRYRPVAPGLLGKAMSPFVLRPAAGVDREVRDPHPCHAGQEFLFVHAGTIELDYGEQTVVLGAGDSAYFDAAVEHRIRAAGTEAGPAAEVLIVAYAEPGTPR